MKSTLIVSTLAVLLGIAVGVGSSAYRFVAMPTYGFSKPSSGELTAEPDPVGRPRIEVIGPDVHNFGVMSTDETRNHTFVVKNVGDGRLEMRFLEKSCQCTDVKMTRSSLLPGELSEITLSWRPKTFGIDFNQVARFETNDPARLELDLTIMGEVRQIVRSVPPSVSFDRVPSNSAREVLVNVFGYRDENLQLTDVRLLNDETAAFFETSVAEMDDAAIAKEAGAKSGVVVKLSLEPGMPLGPFFQHLRLTTNLANVEPIEIPIQGVVVGDIQIFGSNFDDESNVLTLGTLSGNEQHERKLWLLVGGDDPVSVDLSVASTDPHGILEASLDPPKQLRQRKSYPLSIRIKPNGRMVNRLGNKQGPYGRIVVQTNREDAEQLIIKVAFLLEASP